MNKKVDKGFELRYYRLSYRRKFIRTLWMIPWAIFALLLWHGRIAQFWIIMMGLVFAVVLFVQALYNYRKWKAE